MAMYVLLSFDDDVDATDFIGVGPHESIIHQGKVAAVYKKPTQFCDVLDGNHSTSRRVVGFTKGIKWGWWVCAVCHKPRERYMEGILAHSGFGINLLDRLFREETQV